MKTTTTGQTMPSAHCKFALKLTVTAMAAVGMVSSASVWAQSANVIAEKEKEAEVSSNAVVTITGVRRAAQTAQKIKQDADDIVDSIVADDIGKFPDTNVAETIARVTGIQVRRDAGEANSVLIRGLPGIATLLNGREMFTTTGRYIQLADIPSNMLQRADVYKSQSADIVEGGIAGVIDVRTYRPFDFKGHQYSAQGGVKYNDKAGKTDPDGSAMVSNRWKTAHGDVGALVGVSYRRSNFWEERAFETFPIQKDWLLPRLTGPDLVGLQAIHGERERKAMNFAAQWRPNAQVELYAEGLVSRYENTDETDFFVGLPWWADGAGISATKIPGTDQVDTLTSKNANTILSTQARHAKTNQAQYAIGGRWNVTPSLRLTTELARTTSKYDWQNPILDMMANVPNVSIKTSVNGGPSVGYTGINWNDPSKFTVFQLFDRYGVDNGDSTDWRADASFIPDDDGFFMEFKFGVRANKRHADSIKSFEGSVSAPGYVGATWDPARMISGANVPGLNCNAPTLSENYGTQNWYTPCRDYLLNSTSQVRNLVTGNPAARAVDPGSFFSDDEKTVSFYGTAKVEFELGGIPVDGSFGVRVTRTTADLLGKSQLNGSYTDAPKSSSNTDVLPSLNLKAKLRPDLLARLALGKTISRPDFGQLNPGTAYVRGNGTTVQSTASGGNPDLKPVEGTNLDTSIEYYFSKTGMVSATLFRHNFDGYILNRVVRETFQGTPFDTTRPFNTTKGHLQGAEFAYRQFYDSLPGWLGGLGLEANYTYMEGGVTDSSDMNLSGKPFPGLSKNAYNLVLLYEGSGVSARLAYNWRSKFVQIYGDRPGNAGSAPARDMIAADMSTLDGSLSYKITPNLSLNLTGNNLLNFKYTDYWTDPAIFPRDLRRYDRTVGLSLSWKN